MNIVLVQHRPDSQRQYCFEVADRLLPYVHKGVKVVCDTKRGNEPGVIASDVLTDEDARSAIIEHGASFPLREIIAVIKEIDISNVRVPIRMLDSQPKEEKLHQRKAELKRLGGVATNVVVRDNGILCDGYTAYVVCKQRGMDKIPMLIFGYEYPVRKRAKRK